VGGETQIPGPFAFAESAGSSQDAGPAYIPVKRHRGEPGHTRGTRVHTGTCVVSSFINIGCDFQVTDSQVKSSQVKQASKQAADRRSTFDRLDTRTIRYYKATSRTLAASR